MLLIYKTAGFGVHSHVIQGMCTAVAVQHSDLAGKMTSLWSPTSYTLFVGMGSVSIWSIDSSWKCMAIRSCPGNRLSSGATYLHLAGTWLMIKWTTEVNSVHVEELIQTGRCATLRHMVPVLHIVVMCMCRGLPCELACNNKLGRTMVFFSSSQHCAAERKLSTRSCCWQWGMDPSFHSHQ